ncbi:MAG: hypothetical protein JO339_27720 [Alphaproteobacteria bacterium]|nr:hypothetical protein [Alphaproteobacteria bacterium]
MNRIGLLRVLAGPGMHQRVGGLLLRSPTIGRQDKSADRGRAHVVGGIEISGDLWCRYAGACPTKSNDFNGPSAVARINGKEK